MTRRSIQVAKYVRESSVAAERRDAWSLALAHALHAAQRKSLMPRTRTVRRQERLGETHASADTLVDCLMAVPAGHAKR